MGRRPKRTRTEAEQLDGPPAGQFVAIYMRVSYKGRRAALQESDLQRWTDLKRWADGRGQEVRWYKDAWSGPSPSRPDWDRLLKDIEAGRVSTLACWRLDRLGKTCTELVDLFEFLATHGVNLISLKDQFDLSTSSGRRMAGVLASVAVYESEMRAERILAGQEAARARGIRWGGSTKGQRIKVTPEREVTVRQLRAEGKSISHIARETGLSRPTIYRVLGESIADPKPEGPEEPRARVAHG